MGGLTDEREALQEALQETVSITGEIVVRGRQESAAKKEEPKPNGSTSSLNKQSITRAEQRK